VPLFDVVDISAWEVVAPEVLGRNPKDWVREPGGASDRERDWLFKPVVIASNGHRQGEDWAEKIVNELGRLLGIPCAEVQLAARGSTPGVISRNVVPRGWSRILGSELLSAVVEGYLSTTVDDRGRERPVAGRPGHSLDNIFRALEDCGTPPGSAHADAASAFAGYLILDAWVANQDRHEQNWAVLSKITTAEPLRLAPSYDHASSLGFNLTDRKRSLYMREPGMPGFVEQGRANRFEHDPAAPRASRETLVELAHRAAARVGGCEPVFDRLRAVNKSQLEAIVERVPGLSDLTVTFILELLEVNRGRLLRER
jgi:hypothetical protein